MLDLIVVITTNALLMVSSGLDGGAAVGEVLAVLTLMSSLCHYREPQLLEKVREGAGLVAGLHVAVLQIARVMKMIAVCTSQWSKESSQLYLRSAIHLSFFLLLLFSQMCARECRYRSIVEILCCH